MASLLLFALMTSFYGLWGTVDCCPRRRRMLQPMCSRSCSGVPPKREDGMFPPHRCSCSKSCTVYGDCCFDSAYRHTATLEQYDFVCIPVVGLGAYKAVSSCTNYDPDDNCKRNLDKLPPVTSSVTNITYANSLCAWCNGEVKNLITWNVELRCPTENENDIDDYASRILYTPKEFQRMDQKNETKRLCKFYGDFRSIERLELRWCDSLEKISNCSPSWKRRLSFIRSCRSYVDPVYLHNTAYQNAHCAKCNYVDLNSVECVPHDVKTAFQEKIVDRKVIQYCRTAGCNLANISIS